MEWRSEVAIPEITVDSGAQENGLANMVADLIRTNIDASLYKMIVFSLLEGKVGVTATDADVSLTLSFSGGKCVISDGIAGGTDASVAADSDSILELSNLTLLGGLPFFLDGTGLGILMKTLSGGIRIDGFATNPVTMTQLAIVLSVN
jgi:hypothetical protein